MSAEKIINTTEEVKTNRPFRGITEKNTDKTQKKSTKFFLK